MKILARIINFSSMSVYGDHYYDSVNENSIPMNLSEYGSSKLSVEHILNSLSEFCSVYSLRLPGVVGNGSYRASKNFISTLKYKLLSNTEVTITNSDL